MTDALATMLQGLIDYAGLFPPAKLGMAESVRNYSGYCQGKEEFLVGRFACPSMRLSELVPFLPGKEFPLTVIGEAGPWDEAREADAKAMNEFLAAAGDRADVQAYEVRVPHHEDLERFLRDLNGFRDAEVYVELPWGGPLNESLALLAQSEFAYAKARAGGDTIPSSDQLAGFLHGAVSLDWPFKLTAGLHHLFPTEGHHGLLSVLGAVALAVAEDLSQREIQQILEAPAEAWRFTSDTISCFDYEANQDDIAAARDLFVSVGSCSVREPLEELETLGFVGGEKR